MAPESVTVADYEPAWRDLSRRRVLWVVAFLAIPPLTWLFDFGRVRSEVAPFFIAAIPFLAAGAWAASFRCPRCGNRFMFHPFYRNPFTRHCLNCGLTREKVS